MSHPSPIFRGTIQNGEFWPESPVAYSDHLRALEGKDVEVVVRQKSDVRSLSQNAYYWKIVVPLIAEHCGYTPLEAHTEMKRRFLVGRNTTTGMTSREFSDYLDRCVQLGAELGVHIPDPERIEA
jgi:hypothetical protein